MQLFENLKHGTLSSSIETELENKKSVERILNEEE